MSHFVWLRLRLASSRLLHVSWPIWARREGTDMRLALLGLWTAAVIGLSGCSRNTSSMVPGYHWHTDGMGHWYLVQIKTGHVDYWMFENGAGTCSARWNIHPFEFTEDFV